MKAIWKGSLSFGLVNINIELFSAIQTHALGFKMLHAKCKTPVNYHYWCSNCQKKIEWADIVKGLPLEDGSYFIATPEKLKTLRPHKTDTIAITEFVDNSAIEPIYYDNHYYVTSSAKIKTSHKAFTLLSYALKDLNKVAIGTFVMRDKQYVCAIAPHHSGLLLSTLNYGYEIRTAPTVEQVKTIDKNELKLAEELIKKLSKKKFDINQFKDAFAQELKKEIQKAKKGTKIKEAPTKKKRVAKEKPTESLIASLRASLRKRGAQEQPIARG